MTYPPGSADPNPPSGYQPSGYQPGYQQPGYQPSGYQQPGYPQQGYPPQGFAQSVARPGGVTTAAVLGFILGAAGVVVSLIMLIGGFAALGASGNSEFTAVPGLSNIAGAAGGILVVLALLALTWTVLIILGGVRALGGRSRVPLIVAGSISIAFGLLVLTGSATSDASAGDTTGGVIFGLVTLAMAIAIVVLLSVGAASAYYESRRSQRY